MGVEPRPPSALSSSRLLPLVSGSIVTVTRIPITLTAAAAISAANRPSRHQDGEQKHADKAAELARGGGDAVPRGAALDRENLGRIDKRRGVRPELGEKVADAVNKQERHDQLFDPGDRARSRRSSAPSSRSPGPGSTCAPSGPSSPPREDSPAPPPRRTPPAASASSSAGCRSERSRDSTSGLLKRYCRNRQNPSRTTRRWRRSAASAICRCRDQNAEALPERGFAAAGRPSCASAVRRRFAAQHVPTAA